MPDPPPPITLPTFTDKVRARVPGDDSFDDFEAELQTWIERFTKARAATRYEQDVLKERGLIKARRQGSMFLTSSSIRILDLGAGLIVLINAHRAHAAFATTRALVETCASLSYAQQNVLPRLRKGKTADVDDLLARLYVGLDPGAYADFPVKPIRVSAMIKALEQQVNDTIGDSEDSGDDAGTTMRRMYSVLSDHAHPNHSANSLSASIDAKEGTIDWTFDHAWNEGTINDLLGASLLALYFARKSFDETRSTLRRYPLTLEGGSRRRRT